VQRVIIAGWMLVFVSLTSLPFGAVQKSAGAFEKLKKH